MVNTWLEGIHIRFEQVFFLLACFFRKMEVLHATYEVEASNNTVVDWYSMFREVCDLYVTKQFDNVQIGGPYLHVELDETHLTRRKYNRGRQSVMASLLASRRPSTGLAVAPFDSELHDASDEGG